ncbi:MAG: glycosyltransferase family protein, partial [Alphaproteobacteria bacterium]
MANCEGTILFYVQHLFGVGHLFRAQRIAERLVAAGLSVEFVIGGEPVPGLHLPGERSHFLPPVRSADAAFSKMVDGKGDNLTPTYMADRADKLLAAYIAINPDLILIEAFPFGRRFLRPELLRLLDAARKNSKPPLVCCSVRDILQENRKPGRAEEAAATINTYFDLVLVHGDPAVTRLETTFPATGLIADKIRYTGIVADPASENGIAGTGYRADFAPPPDDILVTAGGGAFGAPLLECAAGAAATNLDDSRHWCLVTGPNAD